MRGGVNLHGWTKQREVPDVDFTSVQYHAVEIEEHPFPLEDVLSVVAKERGLHPNRIAAATEEFIQDGTPQLLVVFPAGVQIVAKLSSARSGIDELRIERVVQFSRKHLLQLGFHFDLTRS